MKKIREGLFLSLHQIYLYKYIEHYLAVFAFTHSFARNRKPRLFPIYQEWNQEIRASKSWGSVSYFPVKISKSNSGSGLCTNILWLYVYCLLADFLNCCLAQLVKTQTQAPYTSLFNSQDICSRKEHAEVLTLTPYHSFGNIPRMGLADTLHGCLSDLPRTCRCYGGFLTLCFLSICPYRRMVNHSWSMRCWLWLQDRLIEKPLPSYLQGLLCNHREGSGRTNVSNFLHLFCCLS